MCYRVPIAPKGGVAKPGQLVLLLPQLVEPSKSVDRYSIYSNEEGDLQKTDSTFTGWQFALAPNGKCITEEKYDKARGITFTAGEEYDNIACCNWERIDSTNNGVGTSEQRRCCDRTNLKSCHASAKRIKKCRASHVPDETMKDLTKKMKVMKETEDAAIPLEQATFKAKVSMDKMTVKAEGHEALAKLHKGLEADAREIIASRKAEDTKNKARSDEMIAGCKKQMADQMAAMESDSQKAREEAVQASMKAAAARLVEDRKKLVPEAEAHLLAMEKEETRFSEKLAATSSPEGRKDVKALLQGAKKKVREAKKALAYAKTQLQKAETQLKTGVNTELKHVNVEQSGKNTTSGSIKDHAGANSGSCIKFVTDREAARHAVLKKEWEAQTKIAEKNKAIKDKETKLGKDARSKEAKLRKAYEGALKISEAARKLADEKRLEYEKVSTGGKCCAFVSQSQKGQNPSIMKEECCTSVACTFDEKKTVIAHKECNWHGTLLRTGCACQKEYGGVDCKVEASTSCFGGTRENGRTNRDSSACKTCYKCGSGAPKKIDGVVVRAGDDMCKRIDGPENLCLSCGKGSGLIRHGDTKLTWFGLGYHNTGRCQPYPSADLQKAEHKADDASTCKEACFPTKGHVYKTGKLMSCTKVCSSWNPVMVRKAKQDVQATALCHVKKDSHCHANVTASLATMRQSEHTCVTAKQATPATICYSKAYDGRTRYADGYGTTCDGKGVPTTDAGVKKWIQGQVTGAERWCCYKSLAHLPSWLKAVASHLWCAGSAMQT